MKKIFILIVLLPLFSCNDWLDISPENSATLLGYFKSEAEVEAWVNSILVEEQSIEAKSSIDVHGFSGLLCSDAGVDKEPFRRLDPSAYINETNSNNWSQHYNVIYLANMLIDNRKRFENISEERADFWIAQANFAKAYAYFDIARKWGDAPIAVGSESSVALARSPVEKVLAEAIRCAEAALILPPHEELKDSYGAALTSKQYASRGTVHTLLANIYAWMGGLYGGTEFWTKAEEAASEVLEGRDGYYALEDSISLVIRNTLGKVRISKETIFAIEINGTDIDRTWNIGFEERYPGMALLSYPYHETNAQNIETATNKPKITIKKVDSLYTDKNDRRLKEYWYNLREVKYWKSSVNDSVYSDYAFINKWREGIRQTNPSLQEDYSGLLAMEGNRVIWRYADLLLLRAECRARLGRTDDAKNDLDLVRVRAGLAKYSGNMGAEQLRKEIFNERDRELFGETYRYYDIVRNGYYRTELLGKYRTLTDEEVKKGALYLPVHSSAFIKNPYMEQNNYWLWQQ